MDLRILGPVEVCMDGRPLPLGGPRQRALLALLLMHADESVSRDVLVDELWGGRAPPTAVKTLHVQVSRLRRALGGASAPLTSTAAGYRLRVEPDELDLWRFERLCQEGRRAIDRGELERAVACLQAALAEWRGPPLADVAFEPFAQPEIARLEEMRASATEDRIDAELALGRGPELIGELEGLIRRNPLRERLRAQLMLGLYRGGRQGEALEAYRDAARTLDAELGLRPGPELERLQQAILEHAPGLTPGEHAVTARPRAAAATETFVYVDAAGEHDPAVRSEREQRLRDIVTAHRGTELATPPPGLAAGFETTGSAVGCAVEMQQAADRQAHRLGAPVTLRVGISGGDVEEARRLCETAAPGRIVATRAVVGRAASPPRDGGGGEPAAITEVPWEPARAVTVALAQALAAEVDAPFAGRTAELATLQAAWDDATQARRRGLLIAGEPGIGKTRLAAELARRAADDGGLVLYGHCDDGLAAPAQPFADALSAYVTACPVDELRVQLGAHATAAVPVLPGLAGRLPGLAELAPPEPDIARLRTLDAIAALLAAAGASRPTLLVLDDLHWADDLSLMLLRHVLRADVRTRLLVLATYRDTEPSRSALLGEIVTGLARRAEVERLELGPLAEPDIAAILAHSGRDRSLAARVRASTEGNPFFVGEVVRALGSSPSGDEVVTPRVRDVVRSRLARLTDGAPDVLETAAVVGHDFDVDVTAVASGGGLARTLDALEAAERARLVRPRERSDRFAFVHALVRQTILDDLPGARRTRLHARVADALERVRETRAVDAGELASQFLAAGSLVDPRKAMGYAREAGDAAARRLAFDVAAEHYEQALTAHARLPTPSVEQRLDLELARGRALRLGGDERAEGVLRRAAAEAERAGDGGRMGEALLAIGLELATRFLEEDTEMLTLLRRAVELLPGGDSAVKARLLGYIAVEAMYSITESEGNELLREGLAMARRVGDADSLGSVLTSCSWGIMSPDRLPERIALADELIATGSAAGPYGDCEGYVFRYLAQIELGDVEAADAALAAARARARVPVSRWTVSQWTATRMLLAGRLDDAEAAAVRGAEAAREAAMPAVVVDNSFAALIWCIRAVQGRLTELEPVFRLLMSRMPDPPVWSFVSEAQLLRELGDENGARTAFETAFRKGLLELPRGFAWTPNVTAAADICAWLGDQPRAALLQELLAPFAGVMIGQSGPVARALGQLAITLDDRAGAERHLRDAVALCERMDARAYLAIARLELGELLLPSAEGQLLIAQARTAAEELGMPGTARAHTLP